MVKECDGERLTKRDEMKWGDMKEAGGEKGCAS